MPDPVNPPPHPPVLTPSGDAAKSGSTGLPSNVAAALACIPLIGGIIFYVLEKHDQFVRFYAMQSIIFGGGWMLFNIVGSIAQAILSAVPIIGGFAGGIWWLLWAVLGQLLFLVVFVITVIKAFSGARWEIPYIGPIAAKQVDGAL